MTQHCMLMQNEVMLSLSNTSLPAMKEDQSRNLWSPMTSVGQAKGDVDEVMTMVK